MAVDKTSNQCYYMITRSDFMNIYKVNMPGDFLLDIMNNYGARVCENKVYTDVYVRSTTDIREVKHFSEWFDDMPSADFDADFDYVPCSPSMQPDVYNAQKQGYKVDLSSSSRVRIILLPAREKCNHPYYVTLTDYTITNRRDQERKLTTIEFTDPKHIWEKANTGAPDTLDGMKQVLSEYADFSKIEQIAESLDDHYVVFKLASPSSNHITSKKPSGFNL